VLASMASLQSLIDAYLRHLAIERGVAKNTLSAYRRDLDRYFLFLDEKKLVSPDQISELHVAEFAQSLRERAGLASSSIARVLAGVRGLHKPLVRLRGFLLPFEDCINFGC